MTKKECIRMYQERPEVANLINVIMSFPEEQRPAVIKIASGILELQKIREQRSASLD